MGTFCPQCQSHKAYKAVVTANGLPPTKPTDVIAQTLECGHTFGSDEFNAYKKELERIMGEARLKKIAIDKEVQNQSAKIFADIQSKNKGGRN